MTIMRAYFLRITILIFCSVKIRIKPTKVLVHTKLVNTGHSERVIEKQ